VLCVGGMPPLSTVLGYRSPIRSVRGIDMGTHDPRTDECSLDLKTTTGHLMVMISVAISDLKARLSAHIRAVREGEVVTIMDRRRPVAKLVSVDTDSNVLRVRKASASLTSVEPPPDAGLPRDALDRALAEERQVDR
jgi:prevent-host-death family protein